MKIFLNPKREMFLLFMFANVYSIIYVLLTRTFVGLNSTEHIDVNFSFLIFATLFLFSYYFLLFPMFRWLSRVNFSLPSVLSEERSQKYQLLDLAIFILQVGYFSAVLMFDAGKIGIKGAVVPFSEFWALIQIDYLASFYLMLAPKSRLWKVNFALFALSNLVRGWTGFVLVLGFIYFVKRATPFRIRMRETILFSLVIIIFSPVILYLKYYIRTRQIDVDFDNFLNLAFGYDNYWDFFKYSIDYFINRFQQFSLTWFVWDASDALSSAYDNGLIAPFWLENLYGYFFLKLMGQEILPNLGIYSTLYIPYDFEVVLGAFNISPGLIGWIGAAGSSVVGLILFFGFLAAIGFALIQMICKRGSREWIGLCNLLWFMWLVLLLPGWINQFVAFLHSGIIFIIILSICKKLNGVIIFR